MALFSGFFKNIIVILTIVIFHELGHILILKHYEYEIESVEIYPFGGITKVNKPINTPIKKEFFIACGGVLFQLILILIYQICYRNGWINDYTYLLFQTYNKAILIFNLLPMIPLDGSVLVHSLLERFFSYQKAYYLHLWISLVSLLIFTVGHLLKSLNNYMILTFLFYKIYDAYQKRLYYQNRFYLERYLYNFPYIEIKSHPKFNLNSLKKDTLHFFWQNDRYLHEKEFLKQKFTMEKKSLFSQSKIDRTRIL